MGRKTRIVLGLNSGTSADGVDAAICEIVGRGPRMRVRVIAHYARKYSTDLRSRIMAAMAPAETTTEEICRLNADVGRAFACTAGAAMKRCGLRRLDLVGSHGQTMCHLPPRGGRRGSTSRRVVGSTLQIGDAAIISAELGVPVVSQFRQADMAVGGQGAPLVPWTDYVLFQSSKRGRVVQNIGGIANLTWLPAGGGPDDVIAFDTGPGNMLIDALAFHFTRGMRRYDRGGGLARRGQVRAGVLEALLDHPYLAESPPKSCGREEFGQVWMQTILAKYRRHRISFEDWLATATRFTATTIAAGYALFLNAPRREYPPMDEIILCGGGARNGTLVRELREAVTFGGRFDGIRFSTTADYGIPVEAKEAVSFALLAAACVDGVPANLPGVTGATRAVRLGQVCDSSPNRSTPI